MVSFLDEKGVPGIVERAFILPPQSFIGPAGDNNIEAHVQGSPLYGKYEQTLDRESAYEMLMKKYQTDQKQEVEAAAQEAQAKQEAEKASSKPAARKSTRKSAVERTVTSVLSSAGSQLGRSLVRGLLGGFLK